MARRKTPTATAAGVLPIALAMLPGMINTPVATAPAAANRAVVSQAAPGIAAIYPDADMTPGAPNPEITQDNLKDNLCNPDWKTSTIRPPVSFTNPLKRAQMMKYGDTVSDSSGTCLASSDNPKCYEEDHLVSLENGGNPRDPNNLWPEPYNTRIDGKIVGARQKDLVESFIHDEICFDINPDKKNSHFPVKSSITLERGQEILAKDWYACYLQMTTGGECK
jgi:hypothetical protein